MYKPSYPSGQRKLSVKQSPFGFVGSNPTGGTQHIIKLCSIYLACERRERY